MSRSGNDAVVDEELNVTVEDLNGPVIDRRTTVKLLGAVGLGGLAGCSSAPDDGQDGSGGDGGGDGSGGSGTGGDTGGDGRDGDRYGGRLQAAWNVAQVDILDAHYAELTQLGFIMGNYYSGITEVRDDFTLRGDVAEDWTVEDGGSSIVFDLVDNATFHNGEPLLAQDVQFSLNRVVEEETPNASKLTFVEEPIAGQGVEVEDDYRFRLNLTEPFAPILMNLTCDVAFAGAIVNENALSEMGQDQYSLEPVASGPFKVTEHDLGTVLSADAHTEYHMTDDEGNPLPYLDGLDVRPIQEPQTRVSAIMTGDVDFVSLVPAAQADQIDNSDQVVLESRLGPNFGGIGFNTNVEPFTDQRVRLAVAKAIDEERYVEETFLGWGAPANSIYNPVIDWVYRDEYGDAPDQIPPDQQYDPEGARQLAEEAGVMGLEIEMMVAQPEMRGARVVRNMLNETLEWDVELNQLDFPTLFERAGDGNFNFMPWGNSTVPEPDLTVSDDFGDPEGGGQNWWGYFPDDHAEWLEQQRRELDTEARKEILWKIEDAIVKRAPWALIEHQVALSARRPNVQGYFHHGPIKRFKNVWLDE